jgi:energy-coupling factor transporter ATP-binding protein EcfA2
MTKNKLESEVIPDSEQQEDTPLSAYFISLAIENVRCFGPKQTLDLSDGKGRPAQWTIIIGDNGFGKTTLLRALAALTPRLRLMDNSEGMMEKLSMPRYNEDDRMRTKWRLQRGVVDRTRARLAPSLYRNSQRHFLSANFLVNVELTDCREGVKIEDYYVEEHPLGSRKARYKKYEIFRQFACFGYGASRRMGEASLSEEAADDPFASLFFDDAPLLNAEEWLLQADYAAHAGSNEIARKRAAIRRDEIKEVLLRILPEIDDIRISPIIQMQTKPSVRVQTKYGWVDIKDLSLGYKTLIAWMVDFASRMFERYPDSPNPLAEPAVVLVDEIDLHLHPKWQRVLMSYLSERFPNTQFIATAHSPLVVQAASDANVVLLRREGDHVVIDNDVKDIHGWRVDQILTSDLFGLESARPPQLDNLLAERAKILSKSRLTKKDRARLEQIEAEIGSLPTGETPEDMEAMDIIRRAASHLKAQGR